MEIKSNITDLTVTTINSIKNKNLSDREFRKTIRNILLKYKEEILINNSKRIKKLEEEIKDFRLIKKILRY